MLQILRVAFPLLQFSELLKPSSIPFLLIEWFTPYMLNLFLRTLSPTPNGTVIFQLEYLHLRERQAKMVFYIYIYISFKNHFCFWHSVVKIHFTFYYKYILLFNSTILLLEYTDQYLFKFKHFMDYLENVSILRIFHVWTIREINIYPRIFFCHSLY